MTSKLIEAIFRFGFRKLLVVAVAVFCMRAHAFSQDCKIQIDDVKVIGSCGSTHTGFIRASVANAAGPYKIKWKGSGKLDNGSLTQDKLHPGTYSLTITDALGCSSTSKFQVRQQKAPVVIAKTEDSENTDKGSIALRVNGTSTRTVFWLGPEGIINSNKTRLKNLSEGAYTYIVYSDNGCSTVGSIQIN